LLQAAHNGHTETVKLLLENGAEVSRIHEPSGLSPLLIAVKNGHKEIRELLSAWAGKDRVSRGIE